ncbi:hypothetical protein [Streptomyces sp. NPDC047869]|uniref:aggregation-promoting factor C-terminal-like domain-containing protein n=1 Tax=Streptomyces sp. NPDC047869 TaxID=3154709 RepID=UPI0034511A10
MAISVGSVEVDVIPNAQGVRQRMQNQLVPAAHSVGDEVGRVVGRYLTSHLSNAFVQGITRGGQQAQAAAVRQGAQTGSSFARSFKGRLEAALRDLPEVRLNANSTDAEREIYNIRRQLMGLRDARIGIDISEADAVAAIDHLRERLARLSASSANVSVRVDAGSASAQLAAFQAEINRLDGQTADVDVDTHSAAANFNALTTAAIAFGPAIIPVLPVVAAGLGAIAAAGAAAAAGIGSVALVAVPAFKQIGTVLQAQKAAQDAASQATLSGGQAAAQASSRALQLASAQAAVASAERNGARQIAQAQAQVSQARQQAAQTAAQASLRSQQAARAVQDAERSLSEAQKAATKAQQDLNLARAQAVRELQDMNNSLADAQLSQRQAELDLADAKKQRDAVFANSSATEADRARAQLAYDQAQQALKEQQLQTQRLKKDTDAANKAGVDGSKTVKSAQEQLAQAQQQVADRTRALKDAQAEQARTATQNAQQIAQAQQRIADAQANVANAQAQAAEQAAAAQRQLQQAQASTAGGANAAATAQAKYQAELAKLTPSARQTLRAFVDLKSAFGAWSRSLQPAVMPIFTRALKGMRNFLPTLTPFVLEAADAIKDLQDRASANLKKPFWQGFKKDLQHSVKPAIKGLGIAFGNVLTGMAGIIDAFLPHMGDISSTMQRITKRFANWGKGLKGSPAFERFLSYASEHAPLIGDALGKVAGAFLDIGGALSPVSGPLLRVVGGLAEGIGWLAKHAPELAIAIWGLFLATKLWALWQLALNGAMAAFELIMSFGVWGWIVLAIGAVVLAVIYLYNHFEWFRDAVQTVWRAIKAGADWLWQKGIKPAFDAIAGIVVWLWQNIISPYFTNFVIPLFRTLGRVVGWLWTHAVKPHFHLIADLVVWWWKVILKPQFNAAKSLLGTLGDVFKWLWTKVVKPYWQNQLAPAIRDTWKNVIKPSFEALKTSIRQVKDAFKDAKDAIVKSWSGIKKGTKDPINFVIGQVWNKGVVSAWKSIRKWVPGLPKLDTLPLLARGGTLPVQPGVFNRPTAIVGEGRPQHPEYVIPTDPRYRGRALALWQQAGGQLMADGGILGDVFGGIKNLGGKLGDMFSSATSFLTDPGKALDGLLGKLIEPLNKVRSAAWGKLALALPKRVFKGLKELVTFSGDSGGTGGLGDLGAHGASARQAQNIARALLANYGWGPGQMNPLISLWNGESGWRWNALNASSGAYGIPQSLPASKMASAGADWRTNAATQIRWGLSYIKSRYGSPAGAWNSWLSRSPHWYDTGGMLQPGLNLAYNGTGRPEPVLTTRQWDVLAGSSSSATLGDISLNVWVGDEPVRNIARAEVRDSQQRLIQVINAG